MTMLKSLKKSYIVTLFFGASFAYLVWLLWRRLTEWIGNSDLVMLILVIIVALGLWLGIFSIRKLGDRFTK